jgi:nucleoside-diphosphate-sugar epimerase
VVIGGSGLIGRNVVSRLAAGGHEPMPASPATGVDTIYEVAADRQDATTASGRVIGSAQAPTGRSVATSDGPTRIRATREGCHIGIQ